MFGVIADEKRKRQVNREHDRIICEMAADVIPDEEAGTLDMSDLDSVINDDVLEIPSKELDDFEDALDSLDGSEPVDISSMTSEEIDKHIDSIQDEILEKI